MRVPGARPPAILFVHDGRDWIRGSERCLLDLVARLDRDRFHPVVWCNAPTLAAAAAAAGAEVHRGPTVPQVAGAFPVDRAVARAARAVVRRYAARLIHANAGAPLAALVVASRAERIPVLAHLHLIPTAPERRWTLLHQVTLAVGVSRASVAGLLVDGMPADRATVIYNGVDAEALGRGDATALRATLGIDAGAGVVAVVASLVHRKGIDVAIDALAHVRAAGRDAHLVVCGDGPDEGALRERAARLGVGAAVHFLGVRGDVGAVLRDACDLLVSAARLEAFPLNVLEAGACGLPVVVSDIAPHREAVVHGETGTVVPLDDSLAMAAAVGRLIDEPARRRRMGAAARAHVAERFHVDRYVREFEHAYAGLLARPRRSLGWVGGSTWPPVYTAWVRQAVGRRLARLAPHEGGAAGKTTA